MRVDTIEAQLINEEINVHTQLRKRSLPYPIQPTAYLIACAHVVEGGDGSLDPGRTPRDLRIVLFWFAGICTVCLMGEDCWSRRMGNPKVQEIWDGQDALYRVQNWVCGEVRVCSAKLTRQVGQ